MPDEPRFSDIAEANLRHDARVLGKTWGATYGGYFGDPHVIRSFIRTSDSVLRKLPSHPKILYAGSGPGALGEAIVEHLKGMGKEAELTLVDVAQEHLDANTNPATRKVRQDLLQLDVPGRPFDLVILRSTLDYFPTRYSQERVLANLRRHLSETGVLLHQPVELPDVRTRDLMNAIYCGVEHMPQRAFHTRADLLALHAAAGFTRVRALGNAKPLVITDAEHAERYGASLNSVQRIRALIARQTANATCAANTRTGYRLQFDFPIFAAKKTRTTKPA